MKVVLFTDTWLESKKNRIIHFKGVMPFIPPRNENVILEDNSTFMTDKITYDTRDNTTYISGQRFVTNFLDF
jgi:hypothetical protein